ncbi:uncharacterized protein FPRN_12965 [Fusarium proliferatum]|nr:uncharacterized protein FPRN_12965 [Fusarium proliferatum]
MNILKLEYLGPLLVFKISGAGFDDECLLTITEIRVFQIVDYKTTKDQCEEYSLMAAFTTDSCIQGPPSIFDNTISSPFTCDNKIDSVSQVSPSQSFSGINVAEMGRLGHVA